MNKIVIFVIERRDREGLEENLGKFLSLTGLCYFI